MNKAIKSQNEQKISNDKRLAVIRVRGINSVRTRIEATLKTLMLYKNNYCCVLNDNSVNNGMLKKVKDYIKIGRASCRERV